MSSVRLSVRLPEPLRQGLESLAAVTGRTESDLAREAISEYLLRHGQMPTCFEIADEAGLIGCIETGPRDLSTNPQHMSGFGT